MQSLQPPPAPQKPTTQAQAQAQQAADAKAKQTKTKKEKASKADEPEHVKEMRKQRGDKLFGWNLIHWYACYFKTFFKSIIDYYACNPKLNQLSMFGVEWNNIYVQIRLAKKFLPAKFQLEGKAWLCYILFSIIE